MLISQSSRQMLIPNQWIYWINTQPGYRLRTGGEIKTDKHTIFLLTPRPAKGLTHNAPLETHRLRLGMPNPSFTPALTFGICSPAPGIYFGEGDDFNCIWYGPNFTFPTVVVNPYATLRNFLACCPFEKLHCPFPSRIASPHWGWVVTCPLWEIVE